MVRGAEPLEAVERWGIEPANSEADAEAELATLKARSAEIAHELAEWTLSPQNPQARTHCTRSEMRAHARQAVVSEQLSFACTAALHQDHARRVVRAKELVEAQHASDERRRAAEARRRADAWLATVEDKRSRERRAPPIWTRRADELTAEELAVLERVSEEFDVRDALAAGETSETRMACAAVGEYADGRCN